MEIPDYQTLMLPLLQYLSDGKEHQINECANAIAKHFKLTEKQQNQLLSNSNYPILKERMSWAKSYLKMTGLVKNKNL
jgi:restriction system protein